MGSHQQWAVSDLLPCSTGYTGASQCVGPLSCQRPRAGLSGGTRHRVKEGKGTFAPPQLSADAAGKTDTGWA